MPDNKATKIKSPPEILRRVADPVEPFSFMFVPNNPLAPELDGIRDRLRNEPDLFDQLKQGQANEFQGLHGMVFRRPTSGTLQKQRLLVAQALDVRLQVKAQFISRGGRSWWSSRRRRRSGADEHPHGLVVGG
ncbi:MAG: hypothetical protein WAO02_00385 [Verrucomicrobiia bacterium]